MIAGITISVDGYFTGPDDGPGPERLHYRVIGGPGSYETGANGEPAGEDPAWLEEAMANTGAAVAGR